MSISIKPRFQRCDRRQGARLSLVLSVLFLAGTCAFAAEQLTRGEDRIDVPAVGPGLCVHNLFQSNMVLQRDKPVHIWGWAAPGETVKVSFAGQDHKTVVAADRSWSVTLAPLEASSEPRTLVVKGGNKTLTLDNVLVGDVWVLGGQSNMEFPLSKIENGALEVASAHFKNLRLLTVPALNGPDAKKGFPRLYEWSGWSSRHFRKGDWNVCSPEIAREFSAIGYVFARRLSMVSQVPIGVIDASRGGTTVETWTPNSVLCGIDTPEVKDLLAEWDAKVAAFDPRKDLEERIARFKARQKEKRKRGETVPADQKPPSDPRPGPAMDQNRPGNCYASMIAPLAGLSVRGAIFHQGYNNCFKGSQGAVMYAQVFPKMIAAWRAAFQDSDLPFGILSLCTQGEVQTRDNFLECMADAGPYIREAQYKTFLDMYKAGDINIGFVSTYDLRRRWYHPQLKVPAGERIARWALATQYGLDRDLKWKPPTIESMETKDGCILLHMDGDVGGVDDGSPMVGFAIAGQARRFQPADTSYLVTGKDSRGRPQVDKKVLVLSSPLVPEPTQYRYAWARSPMGNIQAGHLTDIPLATQRSDSWGLTQAPEDFGETLDRATMRAVRRSLQAEDLRRRLYEARTFIEQHQTAAAAKGTDTK